MKMIKNLIIMIVYTFEHLKRKLFLGLIVVLYSQCFLKTPPTAQGFVEVKYSTGLIDTIEYKVFCYENVIVKTDYDGIMYIKGDSRKYLSVQHLPIGAINAKILTKTITNE
jgi:hypothetical protein